MSLTPEEIKELKNQLIQQVSHLPAQQKQSALQQIESLSPAALEQLLQEQQSRDSDKSPASNKPIFRAIVDREVPAIIVAESPSAIAVLDINPISHGHTLVIPKKPVKDARYIPTSAFALAKRVGKRITQQLKAKAIEIQTETKFGETVIHVIPVHKGSESLQSQRNKAKKEDLEQLAFKIQLRKRTVKKKPLVVAPKPAPIQWRMRIP